MFVSSASACQCCVHGPREILHKASERTGGAFLEALRRVRPARLLTPAKTLLEGGTGSLGIVETEQQSSIRPTEPEGVTHRRADLGLA